MSLIVEYLLIVKKADTFCDSAEAFTALLDIDSSIYIDGGTAHFKDDFTCDYAITAGEIKDKSQRYFHVRFSAADCDTQERLDEFSAFLRACVKSND